MSLLCPAIVVCETFAMGKRDNRQVPNRSGAEKPVSLNPLEFEEALEALLQTGPHPRDEKPEPKSKQRKKPDTDKGRT